MNGKNKMHSLIFNAYSKVKVLWMSRQLKWEHRQTVELVLFNSLDMMIRRLSIKKNQYDFRFEYRFDVQHELKRYSDALGSKLKELEAIKLKLGEIIYDSPNSSGVS